MYTLLAPRQHFLRRFIGAGAMVALASQHPARLTGIRGPRRQTVTLSRKFGQGLGFQRA